MKKRHFASKVAPPEAGEGYTLDIDGTTHDGKAPSTSLLAEKDSHGTPPHQSGHKADINGVLDSNTSANIGESPIIETNQTSPDSDSQLSKTDSSSESDSDSEADSKPVARPKFIPKSKRKVKSEITKGFTSSIDWNSTTNLNEPTIHEVDDTDGIDIVSEYNAWKERDRAREARDLAIIGREEQEYEERMERLENAARRAKNRERGTTS